MYFFTHMKKIAGVVLSFVMIFGIFLSSAPSSSYAVDSATDYLNTLNDIGVGGDTGLMNIIKDTLNTVIALAGVVCVVMMIVAGYSYITAAGDENKVKKASQTLTWAIVGLVVCFVAIVLVNFIMNDVLKVKTGGTGTGTGTSASVTYILPEGGCLS